MQCNAVNACVNGMWQLGFKQSRNHFASKAYSGQVIFHKPHFFSWRRVKIFQLFWGQFYQHVYAQLLCLHTPKAQKNSHLKQLFALSRSEGVKAARKHVDEIDPRSAKFVLRRQSKRNIKYFSAFVIVVIFVPFSSGFSFISRRLIHVALLQVTNCQLKK